MWRAFCLLILVGCASRVEPVRAVSTKSTAATGYAASPLASAGLNAPRGIGVGVDGTLYVADSGNHRVWFSDRDGALGSVGAFGWRVGEFDTPTDVAAGSGRRLLYISEGGNRRIQRWNLTDDTKSVLFDASSDPAFDPVSLAVRPNGDLFVADAGGRRLWRLSARGAVEWVRGGSGDPGEPLIQPRGVCVGANGDLYVADSGSCSVERFDFAGNRLGSLRCRGVVEEPAAVAASRDGGLYVCDGRGRRIVAYDASGDVVASFGATELEDPSDIAVSPDGTVCVSDRKANRVWRFQPDAESDE